MNINDKLLRVENVKKVYGNNEGKTEALKGISFDVLSGEFLGIMGASGSGKTTLLNAIATMLKPTSGKILLKNEDISSFKGNKLADFRGNKIGYLFQDFELLDNLTAKENIFLPLSIHNISYEKSKEQIDNLVKLLDIEEILEKYPNQISGGQKQRVAAARALITNPEIILADEPTGALDSKNAKSLMKKLELINKENESTILMVTHDVNAASFCSRILFIQDGVIFHELRRNKEKESQNEFYERILMVMAKLGGGSANVL